MIARLARRRHGVRAAVVRWRYAVLAGWAAAWFVPAYLRTSGHFSDWTFFQAGALSIDNYSARLSGGLHVYAVDPGLQIGPPPLLFVAGALKVLSPAVVALMCAVLMAGVSLLVVRALERASGETALLGGLVLVAAWANAAGLWRHLDDVLALTAVAYAVLAFTRQRGAGWVAPVLLGFAAACKPWAIIFAPLVLALPRPQRARAVLVLGASAAVWWLPFILADPHTIAALGGYHVVPAPGSVLYTLGMRGDPAGWLRPLQLSLGAAACALVVARGGGVARAALAAVAVRVAFDPFAWSYYGLAPLVAALLVDLHAGRRLPRWTLATAAVFYGAPLVAPIDYAGIGRLGWVVGVGVLVALDGKSAQVLSAEGRYSDCHRVARQSKGKPIVRWGRKAKGLVGIAGESA